MLLISTIFMIFLLCYHLA